MREALAVLIPACAIGVFLYPRSASRVFSLALALCLGMGFSSVVSLALIVIGVAPTSRAFVLIDFAVWVIVAAFGWLNASSTPNFQRPTPKRPQSWDWLAPTAFGVIAIVALISVDRILACRAAWRLGCVGDLEPARAVSVSRRRWYLARVLFDRVVAA